jgi:DNA-directed RNA polymerase II subunit RPB1
MKYSGPMERTPTHVPYAEVTGIGLYVLGNEDNANASHVHVVHQDLFRGGLPYLGGCYDAHMGTTGYEWNCATCLNGKTLCPGHYGNLKLNSPVPSPMFIKEIIKWLKIICFNCGKLIIPYTNLKVPKHKILGEYVKITRTAVKNLKCAHCAAIHPHVVKEKTDSVSIFMEIYEQKNAAAQSTAKSKLLARTALYPHIIQTIFEKIDNNTLTQMGKPMECHPRKFILSTLRVPPNTIRPDVKKINAGRSNSNDLTILLQSIMKINEQIPKTLPQIIEDNDLIAQIHILSLAVFELIRGSTTAAKRGIVSASKKPLTSIAKRWPRKYGRIRRNLMGRRANYMGRSFITGDPFRKIDEVGIPVSIAKNIQFAVNVQPYNYEECMTYFMNGNTQYPGCSKVRKASTGAIHWIGRIKDDFKLEIGDMIHRDTITGDVVNFNRQPSLEPSSITSMKSVIMEKGDTLCMNVLSCNFYNADFDGDAMNLIFPRTSRTRNEIKELASPAQFFISYKDGSPKVGEVQDSLIGLSDLTATKTHMDKYHAMSLFDQVNVYHDFSGYQKDHMFSGREIISIYLHETNNLINLTATPSIYNPIHASFRNFDPLDIKVEIDRGTLKSGVLDKTTVGQDKSNSIFHIIHNQYGPDAALEASFYMQQIAIAHLYNRGFTMSIRDFILKETSMTQIHQIESSLIAESRQITDRLNQGKIIPPIGKTIDDYYEEQQVNALKPGDAFWPPIFSSIDPEYNNLYKCIMCGARGALFNFQGIVCAIGQQEINGMRIKENFSGRALPYFTKYDPDPASRGYISNCYMLGCGPEEFLFTAMTARYALINKALSTSITGMHNRMAIKNLEAIITDNQRKSMNGNRIVQLLYGGDGADPRFVEKVKFPTMEKDITNEQFEKQFHATPEMFATDSKDLASALDAEFAQLKEDRVVYLRIFLDLEITSNIIYGDSATMPVNPRRIIEDTMYNLGLINKHIAKTVSSLDPIECLAKVSKLCHDIPYCLLNETQCRAEMELPIYIKNATLLLQILIRSYLNLASLVKRGITPPALDIIITQIKLIYAKALISAGKAVGIIASQSISEPMTQMVLDSHQYSGASSTRKKGMFRIKEILSARPTNKMKDPTMVLHVRAELRKNKIKVQEIANHIEMLPLKQFISGWQIFFEQYGTPIHPDFTTEAEFIEEFEKYHLHVKPPSDLTNWCIRLVMDKSKLIEKQMRIETIYHRLRRLYSSIYIIYSTDNADTIIMRIYLRNVLAKKGIITTLQAIDFLIELSNVIIRGVEGVQAAYVEEARQNELQPDGSVKAMPTYHIFTAGTNLKRILENPYIDPDTVSSDSPVEMHELFGITSGRAKIVSELKHQVSGPSPRHYYIYADEMTFTGVITSIDRFGSANRNSSIMLRISDASPIAVIEESAINAFVDNLSGVSPPIMIGKEPQVGDLYNSFILDEKMVSSRIKRLETILTEL